MQVLIKPAFWLSLVLGLLAVTTVALPALGSHSLSPTITDSLPLDRDQTLQERDRAPHL